jgi:hypothetical protein
MALLTIPLYNCSTGGVINAPIGTVTVDGNSNTGISSSPSFNIDLFSEDISVSVNVPGFLPYVTNIRKLYNNATFRINLIDETLTDYSDILVYLRMYNTIVSVADNYRHDFYPCSQPGVEHRWYKDNVLFSTDDNSSTNLCVTNNIPFSIKHEINYKGDVSDLSQYKYVTPYKPALTMVRSTTTGLQSCCYLVDENITFTGAVNILSLNSPYNNATSWSALYELKDSEGVLVDSLSFPDLTTFDDYTIGLTMIGDYTITLSVTNKITEVDPTLDSYFEITESITTCDKIYLEEIECGKLLFHNLGLPTLTVKLRNYDNVLLTSTDVLAGATLSITLPDVSLYIIEIVESSTSRFYIVNNYCVIEDCISAYILELICPIDDRCTPCPDDVVLSQMLLLSYTYFMRLNSEYTYNNMYSALNSTKLAELVETKQVMDKLLEFCGRRGCLDKRKTVNTVVAPYIGECRTCNS